MTDRELLELAARAARIEWVCWDNERQAFKLAGGNERSRWNPLTDDGDALRLANRTGTCIEFGYCLDDAPIVRCGPVHERDNWPQVGNFPDSGKATRRAIVEAVATAQQAYEAATSGVMATPAPQATDEEIRAWLAQQKAGGISVSETRCLPSGVTGTVPDWACPDCYGSTTPGFKRGLRCKTCDGTATRNAGVKEADRG